jgi:hypothetical protein
MWFVLGTFVNKIQNIRTSPRQEERNYVQPLLMLTGRDYSSVLNGTSSAQDMSGASIIGSSELTNC